MKNVIGTNLRQIMKQRKLSISTLSNDSGVSEANLKRIMYSSSCNPTFSTLYSLAKACQCHVSHLVEDKPLPMTQIATNDNDALFAEALLVFDKVATERKIPLEDKDAIRSQCARRLYEFAFRKAEETKEEPHIDPVFANWLCDTYLTFPAAEA